MTAPEDTVRAAGQHFRDWLKWYQETYLERAGIATQQGLAENIGVTSAAFSMARNRDSLPSVRTLLYFHAAVSKVVKGVTLEMILFGGPPALSPPKNPG